MQNPNANGIFNLGTGQARTWNELAAGVFEALEIPLDIEYIDMPEKLKGAYQYFTEADMTKLRAAGYNKVFTPLHDGILDYVRNHLHPQEVNLGFWFSVTRGFPYKLVIFDWDGTLANTVETIAKSVVIAGESIGESLSLEAGRNIIGLGLPKATAVLMPHVTEREKQERFMKNYKREFLSRQNEVTLYNGALEVLELLKNSGRTLAMATGKSRSGIETAFKTFPVRDFFSLTKSAEETASKPDPMMLNEILTETGVKANEAVMIGDTTYDLEMAYNAGMDAIGIFHGAHPRDILEKAPHKKLLPDLLYLINFIRSQS